MFQVSLPRILVVLWVGLTLLTAVVAGVRVFYDPSPTPVKYTTVCVGEEVMVVKSNKTDHFELAYGANCK